MSAILQVRDSGRTSRLAKPLMLVAALVVVAGLWFLTHRGAAKPAVVPETKTAIGPMELAQADIASVELKALSRTLPLSGSLSPLVQATVKSKVSGEVLEVAVREGQTVKRGDLLARIDIKNQRAQFDGQSAALEKARADLKIAKTNRDNSELMLKEKFISKNAYDSATSTYESAAASVRVAEAQARLAQIGLDDAVVRAPIAGIVSKRLTQPGEKVSQDSPLLAIVDLGKLELEAPAPASEIPSVKIGQLAHFRVGGFGERVFEGRVERINPTTEEGSRSIKLYLAVDNSDGALRGGMFAQGQLVLDKTDPVPAIPVAAVRSEAGVTYVLALEAGKLVRRAVTLGLHTEDESLVEVREGLAPGAQIIVAKIDALKPGMDVVLKNPAPTEPAAAVPTIR